MSVTTRQVKNYTQGIVREFATLLRGFLNPLWRASNGWYRSQWGFRESVHITR